MRIALVLSLCFVYTSFCIVLVAPPWLAVCSFLGAGALGYLVGRAP